MRDATDLLRQMDEDRELAALLARVFEFDVRRKAVDGSPRLGSGTPLEGIAGDFTGGAFYLCGTADSPRPVLYANSEGDAGIIAGAVDQALELVIGFPRWRDCLKYSAGGDLAAMQSAAALLRRDMTASRPTTGADQHRAAEVLGLPLVPPSVLVVRLHAAVTSAGPEFAFIDETGGYDILFGRFPPSRNRLWR